MGDIEYKTLRKACRAAGERHVLMLEADLNENQKRHVFNAANRLRLCGNELARKMTDRYWEMSRTRRFKHLKAAYKKYAGNSKVKKDIGGKLSELCAEYNVTWDYCRKAMIAINGKYGLHAEMAAIKAKDVWAGMEKILFGDGGALRFKKRGDLPVLRSGAISTGVTMKAGGEAGQFKFQFDKIKFANRPADSRYEIDEIAAINEYLKDPKGNDRKAVDAYSATGKAIDTFRPCYAKLKCDIVRGKLRVFIHIVVEGRRKRKLDKFGNAKRALGAGVVGCDVGVQTIAYKASSEAGLENLAERGKPIKAVELAECRINRAIRRSMRANNPSSYNADGSHIKGKKIAKWSKRGLKLKRKLNELRKNAALNRKYAINEQVNRLRALGDVLIVEELNASKLNRKIKFDSSNPHKKLKRFAKSIQKRRPGYFQEHAKDVFESTGGRYIEVPRMYRASQYDHTNGEYAKRKLSDRMFALSDGTIVQRDMYSAFLLYNADEGFANIDRQKCADSFELFIQQQQKEINSIIASGRNVANSGIKAKQPI